MLTWLRNQGSGETLVNVLAEEFDITQGVVPPVTLVIVTFLKLLFLSRLMLLGLAPVICTVSNVMASWKVSA